MHTEIVDTLFDYTQNIGNNEDIVTGALATGFCYCPKFTELLFKNLKIKFSYPKGYFVNTGWEINKNYKWLNKEIKFRPDIMLSSYEEDWDYERDKPPHLEDLVLIESKLFGTKLNGRQEQCYKDFKSEFSKLKNCSIKMLLISIDDYKDKENPALFDRAIKWQDLLAISEKIYYEELNEFDSERIILRELIEFIRIQMLPLKDDLYSGERLSPKKVLNNIKDIVRPKDLNIKNQKVVVKKTNQLSELYDDAIEMKKALKKILSSEGVTKTTPSSYFKLVGNEGNEFYINCAAIKNTALLWVDFEEDESLKMIGKLDFAKDQWKSDWFDISKAVFNEIRCLV
jgi:hypothetical protein